MSKPNNNQMVAGTVFAGLVGTAILIGLFVWYAQTVIPHTYPTTYTNLFWGFVHALFIVPTLVWSLFADSVTIYQAPNDGNWYNIGYFIGLSIIFGGSHGARGKSTKKTARNK